MFLHCYQPDILRKICHCQLESNTLTLYVSLMPTSRINDWDYRILVNAVCGHEESESDDRTVHRNPAATRHMMLLRGEKLERQGVESN